MLDLTGLVLAKCAQLGPTEAAEYFSVTPATIQKWRSGVNLPSAAALQKAFDEFAEVHPIGDVDTGKAPVQILMPIYETMDPNTFRSLLRTIRTYGSDKVEIKVVTRTLIGEARNQLVERFLKTTGEWCVFVDFDVVLPCGSAPFLQEAGVTIPVEKARRDALTRIMSHPKDKTIVGGLYRDRRGTGKVCCASAFMSAARNVELNALFSPSAKDANDGLMEDGWVGFGFVRIHRSVFEDLQKNIEKFPEITPGTSGRVGFFQTGNGVGEDVNFCRRAQAIGHKTYIDTGLLMGHVGRKTF